MNDSADISPAEPQADKRAWRRIYVAIIAIFATWVLLLTALTRAFQ
ncbi:MAG TPA: hypothetical protein VH518_05895 [Tepidisphaeraceae bacterium]|jgi:hypothetical protein